MMKKTTAIPLITRSLIQTELKAGNLEVRAESPEVRGFLEGHTSGFFTSGWV
jgi:hypothetical protein